MGKKKEMLLPIWIWRLFLFVFFVPSLHDF